VDAHVRADAGVGLRGRVFSSARGRIFTVFADGKTRPRVKPCPRGKRGRPDGNFHPKTSVMTSLPVWPLVWPVSRV
jgi:hypothetical protein